MLKFIDESDFMLVDTFKENEDGSIAWVYDEGEGLPTHSGIIREGFTREKQIQTGTETIVIGQDDEGNDITEEQPIMVDVTIDVWGKLWELHNDSESPVVVAPVDLSLIKGDAKQQINTQRDSLISGGVQYNGYVFQTDNQSIMDVMGAIMSGIDTVWLTQDNQQVSMTNADMIALGQAIASHKESLVFKARSHKDAIDAFTTKEDIENYMSVLSWE